VPYHLLVTLPGRQPTARATSVARTLGYARSEARVGAMSVASDGEYGTITERYKGAGINRRVALLVGLCRYGPHVPY
jgi:hypothetical protein